MKFWLFLAGIFFLSACGVSKRSLKNKDVDRPVLVTEPGPLSPEKMDSANALLASLQTGEIDYRTFSAKIKVQYEDAGGGQPASTATLRMVKDSLIWISVNSALIGIEAFRLYITPDSLILLDKLNKTAERHSFARFKTITNLPLDFYTLQAYLAGEPVFTNGSVAAYGNTTDLKTLKIKGEGFENTLTFNGENRIIRSELEEKEPASNRSIVFYYGNYQPVNQKAIPLNREIHVNDQSKAHAVLHYGNIEFNNELSFPFHIPGNYTIK